jgi:hypothetical protein
LWAVLGACVNCYYSAGGHNVHVIIIIIHWL